jgi:uncharacterized protein (TIGR02722 family)
MKYCMLVLFGALMVIFTGCASSPKVERQEVDATIDLSGRWNDTDSRLVSEEMIADCLRRPWVEKYKARNDGRIPTVIVGQIKNRSHEHINVQTFVKDLERELINSGQVQFVASRGEREGIREERVDMARNASDETMKEAGQEIGADYMLIGVINTIRDDIGSKAVMYYQVDLELIDMANNLKVWIGDKKIKKLIKKPKVKW